MLRFSSALIAACAVPFLFAQPVSAEVIKQDEGGFVTRNAVVVKAAPFEAWQALITPSKWWNPSHTWSADAENLYISAQAGGCFCELLPVSKDAPEGIRRGSAHHMTVVLADPARVLRMRGGLGPLQSESADGVLTITLTPSDKGTVIVFEYVVGGYMRFGTAEIAKVVDGMMNQQLAGLARLLGPAASARGKIGPEVGAEDNAERDSARAGAASAAPTGNPAPDAPGRKAVSVDEAFGQITEEPITEE